VISASGKQFDFLDGLAANQREFHETSVGKVSLVESKLAGRGGSFLIPQAEKPSKMGRPNLLKFLDETDSPNHELA